jgi:glycerophosphoryl diester phosphodiesterase
MLRFDEISEWLRTMIIAHRGAGHSGTLPSTHENTIDAFKAAILAGADAIEFDLRRTRNGVIVVHHDAEVDGMKWSIGESPMAAVKEGAERQGYVVSTFQEVLACCAGKIALDIELKETGYEDEVIEITRKYYDLSHVAFTSFNEISIRRIKELTPSANAGLLLGAEPPTGARRRLEEILPGKLIERSHSDFIAPNWRFLKWFGQGPKKYGGLPVISWTINDISLAEKLIQSGIAGIISDSPERLLPLAEKG